MHRVRIICHLNIHLPQGFPQHGSSESSQDSEWFQDSSLHSKIQTVQSLANFWFCFTTWYTACTASSKNIPIEPSAKLRPTDWLVPIPGT